MNDADLILIDMDPSDPLDFLRIPMKIISVPG
jgi:hypothetical protein